jgi:HPt (histidine-containing phosphotransfer) domain-containing protein
MRAKKGPNLELDLRYLRDMSDGDGTLILEMISLFEEQSAEYSAKMTECLVQKDWKELAHIAHKATPSAAVVGLNLLAEKLRNLEILASQEKSTFKYRPIVEKYDRECKKAAQHLRKMFESV